LRVLPIDHQDAADVLHRCSRERGADLAQAGLALRPRVGRHLDLDQLVALEVGVDFLQHRRGEPLGADHHHRVQAMGARFQGLALDGGQL
jgi:hypothetical protein